MEKKKRVGNEIQLYKSMLTRKMEYYFWTKAHFGIPLHYLGLYAQYFLSSARHIFFEIYYMKKKNLLPQNGQEVRSERNFSDELEHNLQLSPGFTDVYDLTITARNLM